MKWMWINRTRIALGNGAVKEHLGRFVKPRSRVLCTFGGGSIERNTARTDVEGALEELECETLWEGRILSNPEYDRLMEIVAVIREFHPDILLAVGGGWVLDGTKFLSVAAVLPPEIDPWEHIMVQHQFPDHKIDVGSILTLSATGSEWNCEFVVSRRSRHTRGTFGGPLTYPVFSLLDPQYQMTLPVRQIRNGLYDGIIHCIDQCITGEQVPLFDNYWLATIKEFIDIGPAVIKSGSALELRERLMVACTFALNLLFTIGKEPCWGIHFISHLLTAKYDIDHAAALSIVAPVMLETQFESRKVMLAKAAEYVFGVKTGTVDEKAAAFIQRLREFGRQIDCPAVVGEWPRAVIRPGDVDEVTDLVMMTTDGQSFGWHQQITKETVRDILLKVIVKASGETSSKCCFLT
jgi:alcohol dehydrogenase YqhD (iron-dependent ADH family)